MMSPLSKGLFHKGISQSGTNLDPWAQPAHDTVAPTRAARLADMVGCPKTGNNWSEMIKCLRTVDAADITKAFYNFFVSVLSSVKFSFIYFWNRDRMCACNEKIFLRTECFHNHFHSSEHNFHRLYLLYCFHISPKSRIF